jgi:WD40 repeat protein
VIKEDVTVQLWEPVTGRAAEEPQRVRREGIAALCAGSDLTGQTILVSGGDRLQRWDPATSTAIGWPLAGHAGRVTALSIMPGDCASAALVSGADDGTVRIWNLEAGTPARTLTVPGGHPVAALCTLEDVHGNPLLAVAAGPGIQVWDPLTGDPLAALDAARGMATAVCPVWSGPAPTGRTVLAGGTDNGTIRIWNTHTWQSAGELPGHTGAVRALCTAPAGPTGPILASAGDDGTIRLWNPLAVRGGTVLTGHTGPVTALCTLTTATGGVLIASGGADRTVRLWHPVTGRQVGAPLTGHQDSITALCESPDSKGTSQLASADRSGQIHLWDPYTATDLTPPSRT